MRDARALLYVVDRVRSFRIDRSRRISPTVCSRDDSSVPPLDALAYGLDPAVSALRMSPGTGPLASLGLKLESFGTEALSESSDGVKES